MGSASANERDISTGRAQLQADLVKFRRLCVFYGHFGLPNGPRLSRVLPPCFPKPFS